MKRFRILGVMLVALLAVSAFAASAASAVTFLLAEWLLNGTPIVTADLVEIPGELELVNLNGGGFGIVSKLLCSGIFVGTVGPGSADELTELLNLSLELIASGPPGLSLECTNSGNCEGALVWPEGLPWKTELELMEEGAETFFADLLFFAGYLGACTILGIKVEELCTAPTVAIKGTNEAGGVVDQEFSELFQELAGLELGECGGRAKTAETKELGTVTPVGGGTLTVSE